MPNNKFKENKDSEDKKSRLFSEKILQELSEILPNVSFSEIMGYEDMDQKAADRYIYQIGLSFSQLANPEEMNIAMQIMSVIESNSLINTGFTPETLFQKFSKEFQVESFESFKIILKKIIGSSSFSLLQDTYQGILLTQFGSFVFEYYRKLKAEMLVLQKSKDFKEFFSFLMGFRTLMVYDNFDLDVNPIFAQIRSLRKALQNLKEKGDLIFLDEDFKDKLKTIHDLIDELLHIQQSFMQDHTYNIQDHMALLGALFHSIKEILFLRSRKIDLSFNDSLLVSFENPIPIIERFIIENWDKIEWDEFFYSNEECAHPSQFLLSFNEDFIEDVIRYYLLSKPIEQISDLPEEGPVDITFVDEEELIIREHEIKTLKAQIWEAINANEYEMDYEVFKNKDFPLFSKKMMAFYSLAFDKKTHLEEDIIKISDPQNFINSFTARKYKIINKEIFSEK